jgi:hypothetical protein
MQALIAARAWLTVFSLPTYAPELNPVEGVWAHLNAAWSTSPDAAWPSSSGSSEPGCAGCSTGPSSLPGSSPKPDSTYNHRNPSLWTSLMLEWPFPAASVCEGAQNEHAGPGPMAMS